MAKTQMEQLQTAWGVYTLHRFPLIKNDNNPLRAWDAADEYVLRYLAEQGVSKDAINTKLLVINDAFGALALSLHSLVPDCWSDSYLSRLATEYNCQYNDVAFQGRFIASTQAPEIEQPYDVVVIKIPKTMALLEDQLIRLKAYITPETRIIAAAMSKHIHTSTLKLFSKIMGATSTSLAVKKARLVFTHYDVQQHYRAPVYPKTYTIKERIVSPQHDGEKQHDSLTTETNNLNKPYQVKSVEMTLVNHANVFAKDKLDQGAQLLLQQFALLPTTAKRVIDLGCGNGVLGIMAQHYLPHSKVSFIDESYMAVASAKASYQAIYPDQEADFLVSDVLSAYQADPVDLIVCNPPFHQQYALGQHLAWQMFEQSLSCLKQGGQLWVVGNRHLKHHSKIKPLFGNCRLMAENKTFVVLMAKKR